MLFVVCRMGGRSLWSFDEVVTKKYGCQDMAYDPTFVTLIPAYVRSIQLSDSDDQIKFL